MIKNNNRPRPKAWYIIFIFFISLFLSSIIVFFSYYGFIDKEKLKSSYEKIFTGSSFQTLVGETKTENDSLVVSSLSEDYLARLILFDVHVNSDIASVLRINFDKKPLSLNTVIFFQLVDGNSIPYEVPAINREMVDIDLVKILPKDSMITDIAIDIGSPLLKPVKIKSIEFLADNIDVFAFINIIKSSFKVENIFYASSINFHKYIDLKDKSLAPTVILFALFFSTWVIFNILNIINKPKPARNIWVFAILLWFCIDARFLFEQYKITKNDTQIFRNLSHKDRHMLLYAETRGLYEKLYKLLPKNKRSNIFFSVLDYQFAKKNREKPFAFSLVRLLYYFTPNNFIVGTQPFLEKGKRSDYYLLFDKTLKKDYIYDKESRVLSYGNKKAIADKKLSFERYEFYYIEKLLSNLKEKEL